VENIQTLDQVADVLEALGYETQLDAKSVFTKVGGTDAPFTAVITRNEVRHSLDITCQIATLGDVREANTPNFLLAALDANSTVRPFAFAIISDADDPDLDDPDEWPVVLTESIPIGDLSDAEIAAAMDNLWSALAASRPVMEIGLKA